LLFQEEVRKRGATRWVNWCRTCITSEVKLAKIKKESNKGKTPTVRTNQLGEFICQEGWIRSGQAAKLLRIGRGSVNNLIDANHLESETLDHHTRKAIKVDSIVRLIEGIQDGDITNEDMPKVVFDIIALHLPEIRAELEKICQNGADG
jgi:hypothetical protein